MPISFNDAIERAKLAAGTDGTLSKYIYERLLESLETKDRHAFTLTLVDMGLHTKYASESKEAEENIVPEDLDERREDPDLVIAGSVGVLDKFKLVAYNILRDAFPTYFEEVEQMKKFSQEDQFQNDPLQNEPDTQNPPGDQPWATDEMPMMYPVQSSNVSEIGYNDKELDLYVKFNNGSIYMYSGVPENIWENFMSAESKGKFVHQYLKGQYDYLRVV